MYFMSPQHCLHRVSLLCVTKRPNVISPLAPKAKRCKVSAETLIDVEMQSSVESVMASLNDRSRGSCVATHN